MIQGPWDQTTCTPGSSGPAFIYSKKRGRAHETGSLAKCRCPMARDQSTAIAAHTSFRTAVQGSSSLLARDRYSSGGWAGATQHTVKRNKKYTSSPAQGKTGPSEDGRPAQAVRALQVFATKFQGPGHSRAAVRGWGKLQRAASPNTKKQRTAPRSLA